MSSILLYHLEIQLPLIVKEQHTEHKNFKEKYKQTKNPPKPNWPNKKNQPCLQTAGIRIQIFFTIYNCSRIYILAGISFIEHKHIPKYEHTKKF